MNYIIFLILIAFSIVFTIFGFLLLKPRYNKKFREDKLIKSDNKTYAFFQLDKKYHKFINSYKIFMYDNRRFLTLIKNDSINYIEYDVVCFKKDKFLECIRIKDANIRKNEEYLVDLPINATSFKVEIIQINDTLFDVFDVKKMSVAKEIFASLFFSIASVAPITLIEYIVFNEFTTKYYNKERVLEFLFNNPAIYISISIFAFLVFIICFLMLFLKNKKKIFKFKKNNKSFKVDKKVDHLFYFKYSIKRDRYTDQVYYKVKSSVPRGFVNGVVTVNVYKTDNTLAISFDKIITKKDHNFNILQGVDFAYLDFTVKEANFKNFSYKDNEVGNYEFINKDFTKGNKLTTYGVLNSFIVLLCVFALSIGGVFASYVILEPFKNPDNYFEYNYIDEENKDQGIEISNYFGSNKMIIVPTTIKDNSVKNIKAEAFKNSKKLFKIGFNGNINIGDSAFEESSLFQVDLANVNEIGSKAFYKTHLLSLSIPESVTTIKAEAFRNIRTLTSLVFEEGSTKLNLEEYSFRFIKVYGNIVIKRDLGVISEVFRNTEFNECFIYTSQTTINRTNFTNYFTNNKKVYFINSRKCNHDFNSFYLDGDKICKNFDGELTSHKDGTCSEAEEFYYKCRVCGSSFRLVGKKNLNNHKYVDGICLWCGKENKEAE